MTDFRPPRFSQDTSDRLSARVIAMEVLGAWNPVPDDRLARLIRIHEMLRGLGANPALADTVFDATLAVLVHRQVSPDQAATLIEPLLATWDGALQDLRAGADGATPLLPANRPPRVLPRREVAP